MTTSLFDEEGLVDEGGRTADQKAQSLNILLSKLEHSDFKDGDGAESFADAESFASDGCTFDATETIQSVNKALVVLHTWTIEFL